MRRLVLFSVFLSACIKLDPYLFDPATAEPDADLLQLATDVPSELREEIPTQVVADDGTVVSSWLLKHRSDDGTPVARHRQGILYCHGNKGHVGNYAKRLEALWKAGYTVMAFDYRGFGKTQGLPGEAGIYRDAEAAYAYFTGRADLGLSADNVALYGWSLGTPICSHLAHKHQAPVLILESGFASVDELVRDNSSLDFPRDWFADALLSTRDNVANYKGALLVMHGTRDTYIKPHYSEELAQAATKARINKLWLVDGAGHSTLPCRERGPGPTVPGNGCRGGFDPAYIEAVVDMITQGLHPPGH